MSQGDSDMTDDAADVIDDVIETARDEGASDATLMEMRARLEAIESRQMSAPASEPVDLSPLQSAIESLGSQFSTIADRLTALEATRVAAETSTEAETEAEDDGEDIAPQIDIKAASSAAIKSERAPARPHFMFRKIGRR